jgi:hypothetical protein
MRELSTVPSGQPPEEVLRGEIVKDLAFDPETLRRLGELQREGRRPRLPAIEVEGEIVYKLAEMVPQIQEIKTVETQDL